MTLGDESPVLQPIKSCHISKVLKPLALSSQIASSYNGPFSSQESSSSHAWLVKSLVVTDPTKGDVTHFNLANVSTQISIMEPLLAG